MTDFGDIDELECRRTKRAEELARRATGPSVSDKIDAAKDSPRRKRRRPAAADAARLGQRFDFSSSANFSSILVLDESGHSLGLFPREKAMKIARERELELFFLYPDSNPPVARLMDYGRYKFELEKRDRKTRRAHAFDVKEVKIGCEIDPHDFEIKLQSARKFLRDNDKVRVVAVLARRSSLQKESALRLLEKFAGDLSDMSEIESRPGIDGNSLSMLLSPVR